jgi:phosphorylase kinase alpha/beta subunit
VDVPKDLIRKGQDTLNKLLPRESKTKEVDLALLSLIYPFYVVTKKQRDEILKNVENSLVREKGLIRYKGDYYYNNGGEAQWTFGFPWLSIIYRNIRPDKYAYYMRKTLSVMNDKGELPELYFAGSNEHNENSPLGWSQALFLVMTAETSTS